MSNQRDGYNRPSHRLLIKPFSDSIHGKQQSLFEPQLDEICFDVTLKTKLKVKERKHCVKRSNWMFLEMRDEQTTPRIIQIQFEIVRRYEKVCAFNNSSDRRSSDCSYSLTALKLAPKAKLGFTKTSRSTLTLGTAIEGRI